MIYIIVCVPDPKNQSIIEKAKSCSKDQSSIVRQFIHTVSFYILYRRFQLLLITKYTLLCIHVSSYLSSYVFQLWKPIFKKFDVKMPKQCPLHFSHDVFSIQELAKHHHRTNLWTCGICGKSFYREPYLDMHISQKHSDYLLMVCLTYHDKYIK